MSDAAARPQAPPAAPEAGAMPAAPDASHASPSGGGISRRAMATNIASNWAWSLLVILSGFLLPRMIDDHLGRHALGIWDLCWSLAVYVELLSLGIVSAVGRYVAKLRTTGDWDGLNNVVNTSLAMLTASCAVAVALVVGVDWVYWLSPPAEREQVGTLGRWLSLLVVGASALQLPAGVYNGILTGWERFDLLNSLRITRDLLSITLMVAALYMGFGLVAVGVIFFVLAALLSAAKWWAARRLFVQMRHARRHVRPEIARDLLMFGGKSILQEFARGGLLQASTLVISRVMGAEAVALFSRQRNLVIQAYRFTKQYSQVFVPRTATLQAQKDDDGLRRMFVQSTFGGFCIALPLLLGLAIAGGDSCSSGWGRTTAHLRCWRRWRSARSCRWDSSAPCRR
jgi:O-antigen/teichoic acid export membrane protein